MAAGLSEWVVTIEVTVEQTISVDAHDADEAQVVAQEFANQASLNECPEVGYEITGVQGA